MGASKVSIIKDGNTRREAMQHILNDLKAFEKMMDDGLFESGVHRIGVEQELHFAQNRDWRPAAVAVQVLEQLKEDPHFTHELAQFNLEINLDPMDFEGECFRRMEHDLYSFLKKVEIVARRFDSHAVLAGVLPTIRREDIDLKNITPLPRYRILMDTLAELRRGHFDFHVVGKDELKLTFEHAMFEAVTASFQVHYQADPYNFGRDYNWAQAVTAPLMAASTNSPILLERRLWRESRIALFQQSVDVRNEAQLMRQVPQRVSFGTGWVNGSALELYQDVVARYRSLLISNRKEDAMEVLRQGKTPKLYGLQVHNGTVYKWNRACYGITNGKPHMRIENRVLPSGPTIVDEVANAAFWLGMMHGMPEEYSNISEKMEFDDAKNNFLKASRQGLGADFVWPGMSKRISSTDLILKELLPIAKAGLERANILNDDIDQFLGIIEERVKTGRTGSQWLVSSFENIKKSASINDALTATTSGLSRRQQIGQPVHTWQLATLPEAGSWRNRFHSVQQIMASDLFTVLEEDTVEYVAKIMDWRNIRHVLVENDEGKLSGLVSSKNLVQYFGKLKSDNPPACIRDIMTKNLITIEPDTSISDALTLMKEKNISCLPVIVDKKLVGLISERDFVRIWEEVFREISNEDIGNIEGEKIIVDNFQ
ncbi:CBS domain-containing protein [Saprospiraceae bacterium]|jgi:CBS domain-containing protein/gamma-glutamyl:cysteine ligase YbdK (ATP-grasp superfamily)|nr:CBS domain-containing protein [Saprospiraceae bacterium]